MTLPIVQAESGLVYSCLELGSYSGVLGHGYLPVGDGAIHTCTRSLASYDISGIPSDATIDSAVLELSAYYGFPDNLGGFEVYDINYEIPPNYSHAFTCHGIGFHYCPEGQTPVESIDVTPPVRKAHRNHLSRWQIRMQFQIQNNENGVSDETAFLEGEDGCVLTITYT